MLLLLPRETVDIEFVPGASLTPQQLDEIWSLCARYSDVPRPILEGRLRATPEIALSRARGQRLARRDLAAAG